MAASSRLMITEAERRFPARIRIAVPPEGLGRQLDLMTAWLDANCVAGNWAMTPSGLRGVVNDALAIYFLDAALAMPSSHAGIGYRAETIEGSFRVREDAPAPRIAAKPHRTREPAIRPGRYRCRQPGRAAPLVPSSERTAREFQHAYGSPWRARS